MKFNIIFNFKSPYHKRETSANAVALNRQSYEIDEYNTDEENEMYSNSSFYLQPKNAPSVYDVIRARNTSERISELEKNNLHLRRMLNMIQQQKEQEQISERVGSAKLLSSRETYLNKLGPPLYVINIIQLRFIVYYNLKI